MSAHRRRPLLPNNNRAVPDPSHRQKNQSKNVNSGLLHPHETTPLNPRKPSSRTSGRGTAMTEMTGTAIDESNTDSNNGNTGSISSEEDVEFEWDGSLDWEYRYAQTSHPTTVAAMTNSTGATPSTEKGRSSHVEWDETLLDRNERISSSPRSNSTRQSTGGSSHSQLDDITSRLRTVVLLSDTDDDDTVVIESSNLTRSTAVAASSTTTTTTTAIPNHQRLTVPPPAEASEIIVLSDDTDSDDSTSDAILPPVRMMIPRCPSPLLLPPQRRQRHPSDVASTQLHKVMATATAASHSSQAKCFTSQRHDLAQTLLERYWRDVVEPRWVRRDNTSDHNRTDAAASTVAIRPCVVQWSTALRTTAGLTRLKQEFQQSVGPTTGVGLVCQPVLPSSSSSSSSSAAVVSQTKPSPDCFHRTAVIELSTKVVDDIHRLQATLLHEVCHAAAWIVDGIRKPPHGPCFQTWSRRAMQAVPGVSVTTTHSYEIAYKYAWACTTHNCPVVIQRQSRRSIDIERHVCGTCHGRLIPVHPPSRPRPPLSSSSRLASTETTTQQQHVPKPKTTPSIYNMFIKEHSKLVRDQLMREAQANGTLPPSNVKQSDVLKECARLWREQKENALDKPR